MNPDRMKSVAQDFVYLLKKIMSLTIGIDGILNEGTLLIELRGFSLQALKCTLVTSH